MKIGLLHNISKYIIFSYILLFCCIGHRLVAQPNVDSLKIILDNHIETQGEDTFAIRLLTELYIEVEPYKPHLAIEFAGQALQISQNLGLAKIEAQMYTRIASIYFQLRVFYLSLDFYFKAVYIFQDLGLKLEQTWVYLEIAKLYLSQGVDEVALEYLSNVLERFTEIENTHGRIITLELMGDVYSMQEQYDFAMEHYTEVLLHYIGTKDYKKIAETNNRIARVYIDQEEYDSAEHYLRDAVIRYKIVAEKPKVADTYFLYGEVYLRQDNYVMAHENYLRASNLYNELGQTDEVALCYNRLSQVALITQEYDEALEYADQSLEFYSSKYEHLAESHWLRSQAYKAMAKFENAFAAYEEFIEVTSLIQEAKERERFSEMQVSLELQKQEKEIEILRRDQQVQAELLKRSQIQNYSLVAGLLFLIAFAAYYFYTNMRIKKTNALLSKQKEEITLQKEELGVANGAIFKQKEEIQRVNKNITFSIQYASRIQDALLPQWTEFKRVIPDSFVLLRPKEAISGDFYWFKRKRHTNKLIVAAVDCTGHGVPGAFMSMLGDAYLNQIVNVLNINDADEILNQLHKLIRKSLRQDVSDNRDGMDMALCVIDTLTRKVDFAGAKNPLYYICNNELIQMKGDNMSVGGMQREKVRRFSRYTLQPLEGENYYCYLFSDGIQDQFGGSEKMKYSRKQLKDLLLSIHLLDFDEQSKRINESINDWKGEFEQIDDMLILGFKI